MPIDFNCPSCGKNYKVADTNAGKRFACKQCGKPVEVPAADTVLAAEPVVVEPPPAQAPAGRAPRLPGAGPKPLGGPRPVGGPGRPTPMSGPGVPRPYGHQGRPLGPLKTSPMAITSLAMVGVGLSLFLLAFAIPPVVFLSLLCPVLGLVFGIIGMVQAKKGGRYKGWGIALAGVIVNGLGLLVFGAFVLFAIILVASVSRDPDFQRQMEYERQRQRGYHAPIHRGYHAPAHQRPEWALFP
jgi:hypothetical protein